MRILAIDSSINSTGWAILDNNELITFGTIKANKKLDAIDRINYITKELKSIFNTKECEYIAIEKLVVFHKNSAKTIQNLNGLYVHLLCEFRKRNWLVIEVEPTKWKSYCEIKGRKREEQKENTIKYVKSKYKVDILEDEADAICIGEYGINLEIEEE